MIRSIRFSPSLLAAALCPLLAACSPRPNPSGPANEASVPPAPENGTGAQPKPADGSLVLGHERYILVPAGTLVVADGGDPRQLKVQHPFYLKDTPVTVSEFAQTMGATLPPKPSPDLPKTGATVASAAEYARRREEQHPGFKFFLPSEEQFEFAARAGSALPFAPPNGDGAGLAEALERDKRGDHKFLERYVGRTALFRSTRPVPPRSLCPNAFGLYAMQGNVWQLCRPEPGAEAVPIRGGAFSSPTVWGVSPANRDVIRRDATTPSISFRLVVVPVTGAGGKP